jgi:glycosyltransferase involved in cell wall biosynthesis
LSVIVPTYNRAPSLSALLEALLAQDTSARYEILVADNASTDGTRAVVERFRQGYPFLKYLFEPAQGASNARNAGIQAASGPLVAFIDDDVRPARDWVSAIISSFAQHPEVDCIGGRIEPRWPSPPPSWLTSAHWGPLALQMGRGSSAYVDAEHASACLVTANLACRAEVFRHVGLFSPDFLRDEDREFNLRLWANGKRGRYDDTVVTYAMVQPERLTKAYHRQWHAVTGASHGRLRYREIIARDGRLQEPDESHGLWLFGSPGFLYRELIGHALLWSMRMVERNADAAFIDECRVRYLLNYLSVRRRDRRRRPANPTRPRRTATT